MEAGDGASEQSSLAERIVRMKRQLEHAERAAESRGAGAAGERSAADRLSRLIPGGWFLLHDVHWPGRPLAHLDHVLVGPGGVVVVDTKYWTGNVGITDGTLRHNGYTRQPAVEGALGQAAAVAALLAAPHRRLVRSIICMVDQPEFSGVTASGVEVLGMDRVVARVMELPAVLDQPTVVGLFSHLGQQLTQSRQPRQPQRLTQPRMQVRPQVAAPQPNDRKPRTPQSRAGNATASRRPGTARAFRARPLGATLWSLLIAGLVAFLLTAPYWGR
jgi:Nuclease-related domain